jgi:hypothetical protein
MPTEVNKEMELEIGRAGREHPELKLRMGCTADRSAAWWM